MRFMLLVFVTSLLTLTTTPITLTDGLESILNPLKRVNFPVHELALMMSISLRFIPTLMDETDKIMKAQMARGVSSPAGRLKKGSKQSYHCSSHSLSAHLSELKSLQLQWRQGATAEEKAELNIAFLDGRPETQRRLYL